MTLSYSRYTVCPKFNVLIYLNKSLNKTHAHCYKNIYAYQDFIMEGFTWWGPCQGSRGRKSPSGLGAKPRYKV